MPLFENRMVLEIARGLKAFLNLQAGLVRGRTPRLQQTSGQTPQQTNNQLDQRNQQLKHSRQNLEQALAQRDAYQSQLEQTKGELDQRNQQLKRLRQRETREKRAGVGAREEVGGGKLKPENIIWIFGAGRTGSTWLFRMMREHGGRVGWHEPYVGSVFQGLSMEGRLATNSSTVFGERHREAWRESVRHMVLNGAAARFPRAAEDDLLVIKEPNASAGAPWLLDAFPESRVVLLVRDPRDVVASVLDSVREDGWRSYSPESGMDPDDLVSRRAGIYVRSITAARRAFESHTGAKTFLKYEQLRADTFGEMRRIYRDLEVEVSDEEVRRAVEKHDWENIPEDEKGEGKASRKAMPGSWREELTLEQVRTVERITAPLLEALGYEPSAGVPGAGRT